MVADAAASIRYLATPIDGIEAMSARTTRSFARHTHDHYGIGLVDAGGHSSWSGRGRVEAGPGTFITVNPGEVHDGAAVGGRSRAWRILYFDPAALAALRADVLEGSGGEFAFAAPVFADPTLRATFDAALASCAAPAGEDGTPRFESAALRLVARLQAHSAAPRSMPAEAPPDVRRARERIDADPAAPFTLQELARESGVSRFQLIRGFRRTLGLSPHAYIVQRRLALARRLIRAGHALGDVALHAGFYDQSHLGRCFVRQFGVAPGRYARSS